MELVRDERGGVTVVRDGHPQSYVQLDDPGLLVFEYVQHLALALDALTPGRIGVTHVGGAGLTLARYIEHTRPGSAQIVLEPDAELTDLVRRELPLPRGHRIRVRPTDGASGVAALKDSSADVIVLDAYDEGRVPASVTSAVFAAEVGRVLRPEGLLLMNLADEPGLRYIGRVAATLAPHLPAQALVGLNEVLKGKRFGNVVLVAARSTFDVGELQRRSARADFPTGVRGQGELNRLIRAAKPFDAVGEPSPEPPDPGRWRLR
ncbi:hypothetical protein VV02_06405 [Luteipulveratus mongoliensis]|uniref:Spermidine synthase n=1 Tax=Luteipulveratus mongoliensis TaxID=571913 RepID=A0A0K1JQ41_9MICO|nr:fused MFS/spermidine synthase [Luteipulveratus mongoliensis]AKU18690.1 hypothetical protein VV02_06405 [Luteipulveratus mongoliensis]